MELKKWMAVGAVGLSVAGVFIVRAAEPTTRPATQPSTGPVASTRPVASTAPVATTRPALMPPVAVDNSNNFRNGRNNGRNTGRVRGGNNRDTSSGSLPTTGPDAYAILKTRSIFVKGDQTIASDVRPTNTFVPRGRLSGAPESSLVFNGVIFLNDEAVALVEDLASHDVVKVKPGDPIAGGRVSAITFSDLAYDRGGKTLHVAIGQTLEGISPVFSSNSSGATTAPAGPVAGSAPDGTPAPTAPGGGAISPPGTGGETSVSDMEAKLKAKRLAESGGK